MTARRLRLALLASLALNLAFVGLLAGLALRGAPPGPPPPGLVGYARALPEPERRALMRDLRRDRRDWAGERAALAAAGARFRAALAAEPFDPAAAAAALEAQRAAEAALTARAADLLLARIAAMAPADRAALAAALERRRGPRHGPAAPP